MRILILNPNSDQTTHKLLQQEANDFLQGRACADVVSMKSAPKLIVTYEDQAASTTEMIQVVRAKRNGYDGFVWPVTEILIWIWFRNSPGSLHTALPRHL